MTTNKQTTIGAFVLGGLVLAIGIIIFFGNFNLFSSQQKAVIIFPGSVTGLSIGAPVTFRGVQVGSVTAISLQFSATDHKAYIPVQVTIDPQKIQASQHKFHNFSEFMQKMIDNGLCAEISTESFVTGTSNIFLDFDPNNKPEFYPELADHMLEIPVHPSAIQKIKSELMNLQLEKLSQNLDSTVQKIGDLADKLNENIPALLNSVKTTSDNANLLILTLNKNLNSTLSEMNVLLKDGRIQLDKRSDEIHTTLVNTNKTLNYASDALSNIKSMTSIRSPARNNLEIILRNLADAAASLRGFSTQIERNPKLLLIGRQQ